MQVNFVVCELCGREFKQITATHLKKEHNISFLDYKAMFPDCETLSSEAREKIASNAVKLNADGKIGFHEGHKVNLGKEPWNKNKVGMQTAWNKGKTKEDCLSLKLSAEKLSTKKKQMYASGELKKLYGEDNPAYGGRYSWNKGKTKENCPPLKIVAEKVSITRKRMFQSGELKKQFGKDNPMFGKQLSEEHKKTLWEGRKNSFTKPELKLMGLLEDFKDWEYVGNGKFWLRTKIKCRIPDFINRNQKKIIEVYGDYWHRGENPNDKISEYRDIGWNCIVIWESEIMSADFDIEKIKYFL